MQCPRCGTALSPDEQYYGQCGINLGNDPTLLSQKQTQGFYNEPTVPSIRPNRYSEANRRGFQSYDLQNYQEALAAFDEAITFFSAHPVAHYGRGYTLLALGRNEEALSAFDEAIRLSSHSNPAWSYYAKYEALKALGRYQEAEVYRSEAIRLGYPPPIDKNRGSGKRIKPGQKF